MTGEQPQSELDEFFMKASQWDRERATTGRKSFASALLGSPGRRESNISSLALVGKRGETIINKKKELER